MSDKRYTPQEKYDLLMVYEEGETFINLQKKYGIHSSTIYDWKRKYDKDGYQGLQRPQEPKQYTERFKKTVIKDISDGRFSVRDVALMYDLNLSTLKGWVKRYNGHRDKKTSPRRRKPSMAKRKKITQDERMHIVKECIANDKNYRAIAEKHNISYHQLYQWVQKYEKDGENALADKRGKRKAVEDLTPEEITQRRVRKLEMENERLKVENEFLKKLEEIERRRS